MRAKLMSISSRCRWFFVVAVFALASTSGCSDGKIARYPVTGVVKVDGQPADGAMIFFCPVNPGPEVEHLRPSGKADASGNFTLTTIDVADGAPAGQYKVLIQWPKPMPIVDDGRDGRGAKMGPDRLKNKYYNLETTPLSATVEEKSNELPPFELTTK